MISFNKEPLDEKGKIKQGVFDCDDLRALENAEEIILEFSEGADEDVEYAFSITSGCLLVRVFDMGRYSFLFPYEISEDASISGAIGEMAAYAVKEELPFVVHDVPRELVSEFSGFRHMKLDSEDFASETYRVTVETECDLVDEIPTESEGRVELSPLSDDDVSDYARLSKDKNVNKYWGYDYSEDVSDPEDAYFLCEARGEFLRGVSMPFAVRCGAEFCGEAIIYGFDGCGTAEIAVRLFPEFWGKGIASSAAKALVRVARSIGLVRLYAHVMKDNIRSIAFATSFMDKTDEEDGTVTFALDLY